VVTRGVGLEKDVMAEETLVDVEGGDLFMLCTDGLTKMVADNAIRHIIEKTPHDLLAQAALSLIEAANKAGGQDNVSVILVGTAPELPPPVVQRSIMNFSGEGSTPFEPKAATELIPEKAVEAVLAREEIARQKKQITALMVIAYTLIVILLIVCLWWLRPDL